MKYYSLAVAFLFLTLSCFSQEDNWDVYLAQYEKGVGSTVINMSAKQYAPDKKLPYILIAGVKLKDCNKDGLPSKKEFEILYKISDAVKAVVDAATKNKMTGTFSYQCERLDYYYVSDTAQLREALIKVFKTNFSNYEYKIKISPDKEWDAYLNFLYPNEETKEYMDNQKVLDGLTKAGDDLSKARLIDHWLYFKTAADRENFIVYANKEKYTIIKKELIKNEAHPFQLHIARVDKVDISSISAITLSLRKKAAAMNGDYDGWESVVVKAK